MDDIRAVMDAAGSERAVLFGIDDGGAICTLFAASYPERVSALVLFAMWAKYFASSDYPWGWTTAGRGVDATHREPLGNRGVLGGQRYVSPHVDAYPERVRAWARYSRLSASRGVCSGHRAGRGETDIRAVCPPSRCPRS